MKNGFLSLLICILLTACFDSNNAAQATKSVDNSNKAIPPLSLTPLFSNIQFTRPLAMQQLENLDWYVAEQGGVIYRIANKTNTKDIFLDITQRVDSGGEKGFLGFALDIEFETNGVFYVSYTGDDDYSYISRFQSTNGIGNKTSEKILLKVKQPYNNHNGGQIMFGPDNYLYIGLGDGGWFGDPKNHGQNPKTLLGSILRIDVNKGDPYAIPESNPFVGKEGKDEIFAYGLRNPWRWSFDKETDQLWVPDVGQNDWEEINIIIKGGNYGWNILEGTHCYKERNCTSAGYIPPVFEYDHDEGQSITGGYVYRGKNIPELVGYYIYGDFVSGKIWALKIDKNNNPENFLLFNTGKNISSFGQDFSGELYVIDYGGTIYGITK